MQESREWEAKYSELFNNLREAEGRLIAISTEYEKLQAAYQQAVRESEIAKQRVQ